MVLCGCCKNHHRTAAEVKVCYEIRRAALAHRHTEPPRGRAPTGPARNRVPIADPELPATVYLLTSDEFRALKIGVSGEPEVRIADHEIEGWRLLRAWMFPLGFDALEIEDQVIERWHALHSMHPVVRADEMPQGGASETIRDTDSLRSDTIEFIDAFHREVASRHSADRIGDFSDDWWAGTDWADEESAPSWPASGRPISWKG